VLSTFASDEHLRQQDGEPISLLTSLPSLPSVQNLLFCLVVIEPRQNLIEKFDQVRPTSKKTTVGVKSSKSHQKNKMNAIIGKYEPTRTSPQRLTVAGRSVFNLFRFVKEHLSSSPRTNYINVKKHVSFVNGKIEILS
jgi:hypothetical protein